MICEYLKFSSITPDDSKLIREELERTGYSPFTLLHAPNRFLFGPIMFNEKTGFYGFLPEKNPQ